MKIVPAITVLAVVTFGCSKKDEAQTTKEEAKPKESQSLGDKPKTEQPTTVQQPKESPQSPEELVASLPPLPEALRSAGMVLPFDVAAATTERGEPDTLDRKGLYKRWNRATVGACKEASLDILLDEDDSSRVRNLALNLNECPGAMLDLLDGLGSPASPPDAPVATWTFREGFVRNDRSGSSWLQLELVAYDERKLEELKSAGAREKLIAGRKAMGKPIPELNLDTAAPLDGVQAFRKALLAGELRLLRAVAYPFSSDGRWIESVDDGGRLLGRLRKAEERLRSTFERATACNGGTLQDLLAGGQKKFPHMLSDMSPEKLNAEELGRAMRRIHKPGDFVVNCHKAGSTWDGVFFSFRKVDGKWRPAGYLD